MKDYSKRNFHIGYSVPNIPHNQQGRVIRINVPSILPPFVRNPRRSRSGRTTS